MSGVDRAFFFDCVNDVLQAAGRPPLAANGEEHAAIEVREIDRVLQILAGPGSGKTEVLVWRVLYELFVNRMDAARILVTTFTKRAATELQVRLVERADAFVAAAATRGVSVRDPQVHSLRIGTVHSLCDELLAEFDDEYVAAGTQVVDESEVAVRLARDFRFVLGSGTAGAKRVVDRLKEHDELRALFRPPWEDQAWPFRTMHVVQYLLAILLQHTETWIPRCGAAEAKNGVEVVHGPAGLTSDLVKVQSRWEAYLQDHAVLDFMTLQKRFLDRQATLLTRIDHVFVDEFQDTNPIQFAMHARWLVGTNRLTVVGDDDQSIYRFRGSDIECFTALEPFCGTGGIPYRRSTLAVNHRSSKPIVQFSDAFKRESVLVRLAMEKHITARDNAPVSPAVRLLVGSWPVVCAAVAAEVSQHGIARVTGTSSVESAAALMFSTSERERQNWVPPALTLRRALENSGTRVFNPRNRMASHADSPVSALLALISYLIDPVSMAPAGKNGRMVEVWASCPDAAKVPYARSTPPSFWINGYHVTLQKRFLKSNGGGIGAPAQDRVAVVAYVDDVRQQLAQRGGQSGRLTLAGFIFRVLAEPFFRNCGFNVNLFRQALFTQLLEANIAPTRLTMRSLDEPLRLTVSKGKYVWDDRYWSLLNIFGAFLESMPIDDPEIEAFEENSMLLLTFHQAKGLEFDHVYVGGTGREPDIGPALRTQVFSGKPIKFSVTPSGELRTRDKHTLELAAADRDREVYVALTRAKKTLTVLHDPAGDTFMRLNPAIEALFHGKKAKPHPQASGVLVQEA
jgi:DNA helicase-2/ATP-dependent DNA helicase PcrA